MLDCWHASRCCLGFSLVLVLPAYLLFLLFLTNLFYFSFLACCYVNMYSWLPAFSSLLCQNTGCHIHVISLFLSPRPACLPDQLFFHVFYALFLPASHHTAMPAWLPYFNLSCWHTGHCKHVFSYHGSTCLPSCLLDFIFQHFRKRFKRCPK